MTALIITIVIALAILVALLVGGAPIFVGFLAVNIIGILYYFGPDGFGLVREQYFHDRDHRCPGGGAALHRHGRVAVPIRDDGSPLQFA